MKPRLLVCAIALGVLVAIHAQPFPSFPLDAARLTCCDQHGSAASMSAVPVWAALEQMNTDERANSCIDVELPGDAGLQARAMAVEVADLWNRGRYEEALAGFRALGELVDPGQVAVGNCWRKPLPTLPTAMWDNDVQISNRHSVSRVALDIHRDFNTLLAVLLYRVPPGSGYYWSVNVSPNGGRTWLETFVWYAAYELHSLSASVLTDYCYVGYGATSPNCEARLRRFSAVNGKPIKLGSDEDEMYVTVYTTAANDSIKELALASNKDLYDNRLYYVSLLGGGAVTFHWSPDTGFMNWHELDLGVTNGASGLDACYNEVAESTHAFVSFIDANRRLRIVGVRRNDMPKSFLTQLAGAGGATAIGAYHDTILCAFDDYSRNPNVVRYAANDGGGDSAWTFGYAASDSTTASESPDVALRKGGGEGLVYCYGTPSRELRYVWRNYSGPWSTPVAIADAEPSNKRPAIVHMGSGAYGVAYLRQSDSMAYFDRSDWVPGVADTPNDDVRMANGGPTILSGARGVRRLASCVVFDAMGRRVTSPKPGVYFVQGPMTDDGGRTTEDEGRGAGGTGRTRKVVIQR
ncbi:hypothetical protein JXD38_10015 [candidate division WOR-3 bacterium]|nr:hypothetical protein [candidate division WOR-3 bacterium]